MEKKMNIILRLKRLYKESTFTGGKLYMDGVYMGDTLEDPIREKKLYGKTAIPSGVYKLNLRTYGGLHEKYKSYYDNKKLFGMGWHKGMIELLNVPDFTDIYIHCGNTVKDTEGCILIGVSIDVEKEFLYKSRLAYELLYPNVVSEIEYGIEGCYIKIE